MERVAVVGGFGFVGSHVVDALRERKYACIRIVDRAIPSPPPGDCECRAADVADVASCIEALKGCDCVIHAAGLVDTRNHKQRLMEVNAIGTSHIVLACEKVGVSRLIYVSSASARSDGIWNDDDSALFGEGLASPYGASKRAGELCVQRANNPPLLCTVSVRPQTVFGPGDKLWTESVLLGDSAPPRIGSDSKVMTPIYVKNLAHLLIETMRALPHSSAGAGDSAVTASGGSTRHPPLLVGGEILDAGDTHIAIDELRELLVSCRARPPRFPSVVLPLWAAWLLACFFELLDLLLCLLRGGQPLDWRCLKLTRAALYYMDGANFRFKMDAYQRVGLATQRYSFPEGVRKDMQSWAARAMAA